MWFLKKIGFFMVDFIFLIPFEVDMTRNNSVIKFPNQLILEFRISFFNFFEIFMRPQKSMHVFFLLKMWIIGNYTGLLLEEFELHFIASLVGFSGFSMGFFDGWKMLSIICSFYR
jgi:hypothetical protein